ncbi:MAG: hypothetical protein ABI574_07080 [Burkholderiales bacterium]
MTARFYPPERGSLVGARRDVPGILSGERLSVVLVALGLGAVLVNSWMACARTHRQRMSSRPQTLPEKLQTWEGEGGGLVEGSHQPELGRPVPPRT